MRVTHAGIYLQKLVMVYSLLVVNIRVIYLKHMSVENTSVHRQEYSTKYYCWHCQLKLDYVCTSLHTFKCPSG